MVTFPTNTDPEVLVVKGNHWRTVCTWLDAIGITFTFDDDKGTITFNSTEDAARFSEAWPELVEGN